MTKRWAAGAGPNQRTLIALAPVVLDIVVIALVPHVKGFDTHVLQNGGKSGLKIV